ncbi:uncharacterized protein V6R79_002932 [Siganus canaliculatus]
MLAFDLPDYSKSSAAQNEKLEREEEEEGESAGARYPRRLSRLSRILPPSLRASRRFGAAVMSESEETQSGQSLIWQLRWGERENEWRRTEKEKKVVVH